MKKRTIAFIAVPVVVAGGLTAVLLTTGRPAPPADAGQPAVNTASVSVRDLSRTETMNGVIAYRDERDLTSSKGGIVTMLPGVGDTVKSGGVLMRVDERPVVLFNGTIPAYRDLGPGITDGPDVAQLEETLVSLGYGKKSSTYPDAHWNSVTTTALKKYQEDVGAVIDGIASLGEISFTPGDIRIAKRTTTVGAPVVPGQAVLTVSGTERLVTVDLDPADRELVAVGAAVKVEPPNGEKVDGTIEEVGTALEAGADGKQVYKLKVKLADATAGDNVALAPVTVRYTTVVAQQALTVPVAAVVGVPGGGYAVDVLPPQGGAAVRTPVELGAWGDGFVVVTGGVQAGDKVEVPK
ncbi:HlyD family efflux transporter periplasmic adaptor subunit [Amycolatopsis sp. YIM 10]|uniref:HlyD family efflux transporter periplasmic adaptor subunit n=1 Tax=Amycolatopsis sp. YIM 10 TaxID=2653857 RepID=UPI0012906DD1|nr:HlyD family efflux transporter periplasmic adaptor subunit [Amycolatopsis sp. YIM 10]QFU93216.1 HlyD family secretion protein [Amycolatopsis sp. YIM 10]